MSAKWYRVDESMSIYWDESGADRGAVEETISGSWLWRAGSETGSEKSKPLAKAKVERRVGAPVHWDVFVSWVALKWKWSTPSDPRADAHDRLQWVTAAVDSERAARIALGAAAMVGNDEFDRLLAEWRASITDSSPTTTR